MYVWRTEVSCVCVALNLAVMGCGAGLGHPLPDPSPDSFLLPRRSSSPTAWIKASGKDWVTLGGEPVAVVRESWGGCPLAWGVPRETLADGDAPLCPGGEQSSSLERGMGVGTGCVGQGSEDLGPSPASCPLALGSWTLQPSLTSVFLCVKWE